MQAGTLTRPRLAGSPAWLRRALGQLGRRGAAAEAPPRRLRRPRRGEPAAARAVQAEQAPASAEPSLLEAALADGAAAVVLRRGKARLFWEGAPTVYGGAVERVLGRPPPRTGDAAILVDEHRQPLGWGVFNADSMFTLRVLQWAGEVSARTALDVPSVVEQRVRAAVQLRAALGLPSERTNAYRLINSEGDRLSGLVVDVFGDCLVAASSAAWVELRRPCIEAALRQATGLASVTWRPAAALLKLEGVEPLPQPNGGAATPPQAPGNAPAKEAGPSHATALENGLSFRVSLRHGQKTGFYADQRESRGLIGSLAKGRRLLDLCCYTGGFALSAAAGGAVAVTGVDSSEAALSLARENAEALSAAAEVAFLREECERFMAAAAERRETWDIVVLDPPKLAPNKAALQRAKRKYVKLNTAALRVVAPGGLLMTCSCSGAVAQSDGLLPLVREAAQAAGRRVALLRSAGAGMDHPIDPAYPEGRYLTNLLLRVS